MTTSGVTSSGSSNTVQSTKKQMKTEDFIKMMITQLQNQDPMEPMKNQELMSQMNQISQLQSSSQLQDVLTKLSLQNQIGAAGNLIGKLVRGVDPNSEQVVQGLVTSVKVTKDGVSLELDNGQSLAMEQVTDIAPLSYAGVNQ